MKLAFATITFFLIFSCTPSRAQSSSAESFSMVVDTAKQTITIELIAPQTIFNLLVRMNIPGGRTVFSDNKYKFSGHYYQLIDLTTLGKGTYSLEIIKDNEHIRKTITL